ncbi:MAG: radical SAM protein [Proteobacteria bacterium]|nr:radical SAM protein [Pseudomonadota bacterium]
MSTTAVETNIDILDPAKFVDPNITAKGERRASVGLHRLETLWFNTGTLCNLTCANCYIESSPTNDRLAYIALGEVRSYLDEIRASALPTREIGFTGGEPFMNPEIVEIIELCLSQNFKVLLLTNGMRPMMKLAEPLCDINNRLGQRLTIRVSLDHYTPALHEIERGQHSWVPAIAGLKWLSDNGFTLNVAGRTYWNESETSLRAGYGTLFEEIGISIDVSDPAALLLLPEMDEQVDVPEITEACWGILGVEPQSLMCATSRMVVKRKQDAAPTVMPCTLLPYDPRFQMGSTLARASGKVKLNHPHCAKFCVLGGGSCSVAD